MKIEYKYIKHGYVRIDEEGKLFITIPICKKDDEAFKHILIKKGETLLKRFQKKTHISPIQKNSILLFGELVPFTEINKQYGVKETKPSEFYRLPSITKMLKNILEEYATPLFEKYSKKVGEEYKKLKFKKMKSKRGSCTFDQHISLNLDLVHLPTKFIKYIIIHECCHLKIKNHSKQFWELVEKLCPDYDQIKKELKKIVIIHKKQYK